MTYTATITDTSPNYSDPSSFTMVVQFTDPTGNNTWNKEYIVPVTNQSSDTQTLIQADIDNFNTSFAAANQIISDLLSDQNVALSINPDLVATVQEAAGLSDNTLIQQ